MRILLAAAVDPDPRYGTAKLVVRLGSELEQLGHDVHYLFVDALPRWARHYRIAWLVFPFVVAAKVARARRTGASFDVADVSGGDGWLIALFKKHLARGTVVICRSHGWEHEDYRLGVRGRTGVALFAWRRGLLMRLVRLPCVEVAARRSDAVLVSSSSGRAFALQRGWNTQVVVVPCGLDEVFVTCPKGEGRAGIIYVGTWFDLKGVEELARAYELVRMRGVEVTLSIVGFRVPMHIVLQSFSSEVRKTIRISESHRLLDHAALMEQYRSHAMLVFPSRYEGFGMVFLEAMACGLPVIATPVGGVVDFIRHGENGYIVPVGDVQALADGITALWGSLDTRTRLGDAARDTVRHVTWREVANRTIRTYGAVLEGKMPVRLATE